MKGRKLLGELDADIREHLQHEIDENIARGMNPEEARRAALLAFGSIPLVKEDTRDVWVWRWLEDLWQDLRYAARVLKKNPVFSIATIATLSLAIGANSAIFSVVNTVLLKPIAAPDPDRVVAFLTAGSVEDPQTPQQFGIPALFNVWREQSPVFEDVAAYRLGVINLTGGASPEQISYGRVSADFFRLFGGSALRGRTFSREEDLPGGGSVVVLSYELWTRRFGQDPGIVGESIVLAGQPHTIIGVLGPTFGDQLFDSVPDVWVPFQIGPNDTTSRQFLRVAGRLKSEVTPALVEAQLTTASQEFKRRNPEWPLTRFAIQPIKDLMVGNIQGALWTLWGSVGFVLLIACVNVAGLLFVRVFARTREMTIRKAVGANRARLIRQLLAESLLLAVCSAGPGLVLGNLGIRMLLAANAGNPDTGFYSPSSLAIPRIGPAGALITLDWRVIGFTLGLSIFTGFASGLFPAIQSIRSPNASPHRTRVQSLLVIAQVALALVIVTASALFARTMIALRAVDLGFSTQNVVTMRTSLGGARFSTPAGLDQVVAEGIRRLHELPGTIAASASCCLPMEDGYAFSFRIVGRPAEATTTVIDTWWPITSEYFDTFKIPITRGRSFTPNDTAQTQPVVIINQVMAEQLWPGANPIGDQLVYDVEGRPRLIVGVVGTIHSEGPLHDPMAATYIPLSQTPPETHTMVVSQTPLTWTIRTARVSSKTTAAIETAIKRASGIGVGRVQTMDSVLARSTSRHNLFTQLFAMFGVFALVLSAIGMYGLIAYAVQQRHKEMSIRIALGAEPKTLRNRIVLRGTGLACVGIVIGIVAAMNLTKFLDSFLFGVKAQDATVFTGVALVLGIVAFFATWLPARRAIRIDPAAVLRLD